MGGRAAGPPRRDLGPSKGVGPWATPRDLVPTGEKEREQNHGPDRWRGRPPHPEGGQSTSVPGKAVCRCRTRARGEASPRDWTTATRRARQKNSRISSWSVASASPDPHWPRARRPFLSQCRGPDQTNRRGGQFGQTGEGGNDSPWIDTLRGAGEGKGRVPAGNRRRRRGTRPREGRRTGGRPGGRPPGGGGGPTHRAEAPGGRKRREGGGSGALILILILPHPRIDPAGEPTLTLAFVAAGGR